MWTSSDIADLVIVLYVALKFNKWFYDTLLKLCGSFWGTLFAFLFWPIILSMYFIYTRNIQFDAQTIITFIVGAVLTILASLISIRYSSHATEKNIDKREAESKVIEELRQEVARLQAQLGNQFTKD